MGPIRLASLTTFDLDEYLYDALRAGASGFLLKDVPGHQLAAGVRMIAAGDARLAPSITRRLFEEFSSAPAAVTPPPGLDELTPRLDGRDQPWSGTMTSVATTGIGRPTGHQARWRHG